MLIDFLTVFIPGVVLSGAVLAHQYRKLDGDNV
jgi:hypothetical protein